MFSELVQKASFRTGESTNLVHFLDVLLIWQGMNPQSRQITDHIEYETDNWINAFNLTLFSRDLLYSFSECFKPVGSSEDRATLLTAARGTAALIDGWVAVEQANELMAPEGAKKSIEFIRGVKMDVDGFRVSVQSVSFHHPLHWFLSHLLKGVPLLEGDGIWKEVFGFEEGEFEDRVMRLVEPTIRVASLLSQIKTGRGCG
jgi:E3 ubiquitin-protein ligase UBR1